GGRGGAGPGGWDGVLNGVFDRVWETLIGLDEESACVGDMVQLLECCCEAFSLATFSCSSPFLTPGPPSSTAAATAMASAAVAAPPPPRHPTRGSRARTRTATSKRKRKAIVNGAEGGEGEGRGG
ncbi:unnamed protein product, partial [Discosporangium mesarthrocarpum]